MTPRMDWLGLLGQQTVYPQFLAIVGMVALAAALLYIDFNNMAHRGFALLLVFRAMVMLSSVVRDFAIFTPPERFGGLGNPEAAALWGQVAPYFVIPMPFLIVWFASIYPRRRGPFGATRWGPWVLVAAILGFEAIYFFDHSTYIATEVLSRGDNAGNTWTAIAYRSEGPLAYALGLMYFGFAALTLVFTVDYIKLPPGPRKNGVFVVMLGFLLNATFDSTLAFSSLLADFDVFSGNQLIIMNGLGIVPVATSFGLLIYHSIKETDPVVDLHIRRAFILAGLAILSALFLLYNPFAALGFMQLALTGFWRLWLPALVTYALVRHQLFDIDLKLKFALKQSTLAGLALVGFLVFSELLESVITSNATLTARIPTRIADVTSLAIAVGLTYALNPVQRFAETFTNRAMPNTQSTEAYLARKRLEVYRATLEGAVEDGAMTPREIRLLERLREQLGLEKTQTDPLLNEVLKAFEGHTMGRHKA